jgi:hypothetical protein
MQRRQFSPLFLGVALLVLPLQGCAFFQRAKPASPIAGVWTNQTGAVWTLKNDGTFDVDVTGDGQRDTHGKYSVKNDTITLHNTGMIPKSCSEDGVYHFTRNGAELSFTLVRDDCRIRRKMILLAWHLQSE